jgi:hypothetical protein
MKRGTIKTLRGLQKRYSAAQFGDGWAIEIGGVYLVSAATGERVGPFELLAEIVPVLLTPRQALALLDATTACMDDRGNVSKKWFPQAVDRDDAERAIEVLRNACLPLPEMRGRAKQ